MPFHLFADSFTEMHRSEHGKNWPAGMFDYQIIISQELTTEEQDEICQWCAENCTENFIVALKTDQILAGGCTDNLGQWREYGRQSHEVIETLRIRLVQKDVMLFRMTWVL